MTTCGLVSSYWYFGGACCLHLKDFCTPAGLHGIISQKTWLFSALLWQLKTLYKNCVYIFLEKWFLLSSPPPLSSCLPEIEVFVSQICHGSMSIVKMRAGVYFFILARFFFSSTTKRCLLHETVSFYMKVEDHSHTFFCLDSVQKHMGIS